jgi:PASTA domain
MSVRSRSARGPWLLLGALLLLGPAMAAPSLVRAVEVDCSEPYDDPSTPCPIDDGAVVQGVIARRAGVDYFQFTTRTADVHAHVELTELPADYDLYLADGDAQLIDQSVHDGLTPEVIDTVLPDPGTFYLYVVCDPSVTEDPADPFRLTLSLVAPAPPTAPPTATAVPTRPPTAVPTRTPAPSPTAPRRQPTPTVPTGPQVVPDVAGKTEPEAARLLAERGFRTATARRPSQTVPPNLAIGTDPGVGAVRPAGSTVTILLSSGGR